MPVVSSAPTQNLNVRPKDSQYMTRFNPRTFLASPNVFTGNDPILRTRLTGPQTSLPGNTSARLPLLIVPQTMIVPSPILGTGGPPLRPSFQASIYNSPPPLTPHSALVRPAQTQVNITYSHPPALRRMAPMIDLTEETAIECTYLHKFTTILRKFNIVLFTVFSISQQKVREHTVLRSICRCIQLQLFPFTDSSSKVCNDSQYSDNGKHYFSLILTIFKIVLHCFHLQVMQLYIDMYICPSRLSRLLKSQEVPG